MLARNIFVQRNEKAGKNYRKHLALVIGIDYKTVDRQAVKAQGDIPALNNRGTMCRSREKHP